MHIARFSQYAPYSAYIHTIERPWRAGAKWRDQKASFQANGAPGAPTLQSVLEWVYSGETRLPDEPRLVALLELGEIKPARKAEYARLRAALLLDEAAGSSRASALRRSARRRHRAAARVRGKDA